MTSLFKADNDNMPTKKPVIIIKKKKRTLTLGDACPTLKKAAEKAPFQPRNEAEKQALIKAQHKKDKEESRKAAEARKKLISELRHKLCDDYPDIFNKENPKPLAIGIHKQIQQLYPEYSHRIINMMLGIWVKHPRYREVNKDPESCERHQLAK